MSNHQEKLSLLQDLILLSRADDHVQFSEENFIFTIAQGLGISEIELNKLKETGAPYAPENKELDRIIQFYRLLLLMGVDSERHQKEIDFCKESGLKMGLNPVAINEIIQQMISSESGTLPPESIIKIFQTYHN